MYTYTSVYIQEQKESKKSRHKFEVRRRDDYLPIRNRKDFS